MSLLEKKFKDDNSQDSSKGGDFISTEFELNDSKRATTEENIINNETEDFSENREQNNERNSEEKTEVNSENFLTGQQDNKASALFEMSADSEKIVDEASQVENKGHNLLNKTYSSKILILAILFIAVLFFIIYSLLHKDVQREKADSPRSATKLLSQILIEDDYEDFKSLFLNSSDINEAYFANSKEQLLGEAIINEYVILTKDDGRMFLLALKKNDDNNKYRLRFIKEIPTDIRQFFNDKAESKVDRDFEELLNSKNDTEDFSKKYRDETIIDKEDGENGSEITTREKEALVSGENTKNKFSDEKSSKIDTKSNE